MWCWQALGPILVMVKKVNARAGRDHAASANPLHSTHSPKKLAPETYSRKPPPKYTSRWTPRSFQDWSNRIHLQLVIKEFISTNPFIWYLLLLVYWCLKWPTGVINPLWLSDAFMSVILIITGSGNGFLLILYQAITWTNTNFPGPQQ